MSRISIVDLEVFYHVGVSDEERSKPQRLLITVEMDFDFSTAALSDRVEKTINYYDVAQDLLKYGEGRSWKLIEKVVVTIADFILARYKPETVTVEIKKFPIPQARHVSVIVARTRNRM
jgi:FolB domain-containing protein